MKIQVALLISALCLVSSVLIYNQSNTPSNSLSVDIPSNDIKYIDNEEDVIILATPVPEYEQRNDTDVVVVYGGSFNPPTIGHMLVITELLNRGFAGKVLVVPTGKREDKVYTTLAYQRLDMVKMMVYDTVGYDERIVVSDVDIYNEESLPIYQLMELLKRSNEYRGYKLKFFLSGTDTVNNMSTWKDGDKLMTDVDFVLSTRGTETFEDLHPLPKSYVFMQDMLRSDISSSMARKRIKTSISKNEDIRKRFFVQGILTKSVVKYITEHRLYND